MKCIYSSFEQCDANGAYVAFGYSLCNEHFVEATRIVSMGRISHSFGASDALSLHIMNKLADYENEKHGRKVPPSVRIG